MSEATIKRKLSTANKKAGRILGRVMNVYRPLSLTNALSPANFILSQPAAFSVSESFQQNQGEKFKPYIVYTDDSKTQVGDIFSDDQETFVIVTDRGLENVIAYKASHLIEVLRVDWTTTDGLQAQRTTVMRNLPASVIGVSSSTDVSVIPANATSPAKRYEIRIWKTNTGIQKSDNIKLPDGSLLLIDTITDSDISQILICSEVA